MATKKQLERKKKAREQKAKARVEARRHKMNLIKKDERKSEILNRRFREKIEPIIKDPEVKKRMDDAKMQRNLKKLEKNAEILKALEAEYELEQKRKREINEILEAEGHKTLEEKLKALEEKAKSSMSEVEAETGMIDLTPKNNE